MSEFLVTLRVKADSKDLSEALQELQRMVAKYPSQGSPMMKGYELLRKLHPYSVNNGLLKYDICSVIPWEATAIHDSIAGMPTSNRNEWSSLTCDEAYAKCVGIVQSMRDQLAEDIAEGGQQFAHDPLEYFPEMVHITPSGKAGLK